MERIIRKHICEHLVNHSVVSTAQHGFIVGKSCLINLLFLDKVTKRLDENHRVEVCYMDLSKAFDSVSHNHLDHKMKGLGVKKRVNAWVNNFLRGKDV